MQDDKPAAETTDLKRELAWIICAHHGDNADFGGPGECERCEPEERGIPGCRFLAERAAGAVLDKLREKGAQL